MDSGHLVTLRKWDALDFRDPVEDLVNLIAFEILTAGRIKEYKVRTLRTHRLNWLRQNRQAALFCYGFGAVLQRPIEYAPVEESDYDCVFRWHDGNTTVFAPVQLKEVVPDRVNPRASLDGEIKKLSKYADSDDLIVAIHINRAGGPRLEVTVPRLNLAALWVFGANNRDLSRWFYYGDLLREPSLHKFSYPRLRCRDIAKVSSLMRRSLTKWS